MARLKELYMSWDISKAVEGNLGMFNWSETYFTGVRRTELFEKIKVW